MYHFPFQSFKRLKDFKGLSHFSKTFDVKA